jgi:hypothetical protein
MARWLAILIIILSLAASGAFGFPKFLIRSSVDCTAPDKLDFSNEINRLATLVDWRTTYYQLAWWFSMITIPVLYFVLGFAQLDTHERPDKTH